MPSIGPTPRTGGIINSHGGGIVTMPPRKSRFLSLKLTANKRVYGLYAMRRDIAVNESPMYCSPTDSLPFTITFEQASTVTVNASTATKLYKSQTDVTSTFVTGTTTVSGNVVTLPVVAALTGGERFVLELTATVDGILRTVIVMLIVRLTGAEQ